MMLKLLSGKFVPADPAGVPMGYGRSPAQGALKDIRDLNLMTERVLSYGHLEPGTTVYRYAPFDWRVLPDPVLGEALK